MIPDSLRAYCEAHTKAESAALAFINRDTHAHVLRPRMLSGHLQGRFLALLSHLLRPAEVLEIGTYTGYSAICLAEGLAPAGRVVTIDYNPEVESRARANFQRAGVADRIDFRVGDARLVIPTLAGPFDLVFIDADKTGYETYYDLVFPKLRIGGVLVADNVLWDGKVVQPQPDKDTRALLAFNARVQEDIRVENVMLPIRDGLLVARKVAD